MRARPRSARARTEEDNRQSHPRRSARALPAHVAREAPYLNAERKRSFRSALLAALELRSALLAECLYALAEIVRRSKQSVRQAFDLEAEAERAVVRVVQETLCHRQGQLRVRTQLLDEAGDRCVQLRGRNDLRH